MRDSVLVGIPGPTPVARSIQAEMARDMQAFGDPRFVADYGRLIADLGTLLNCSGQAFPLAGTGTLAMEMAIANTTKRGDNVLIVSHGFFGDRFIEICERKGLVVDVLAAEWGLTVPVAQIEAKLAEKPYAIVTVSHVDTATGVAAPVAEIGAMLKAYPGTLYIVDGVAATAGEFEDVDGMGIDILFTGSQKAFGVCPGMFILWASERALARRRSLGTIPEYFVDFEKWLPVMTDPSKYFATPAINLVWALKEAVRIVAEEGLRARADRHAANARAMQAALTALGFRVLAAEGCRAVTLSNLVYPEGLDDAKFRSTVFAEGMTVAGGLGAYAGRMFRLGHMGNIGVNDEVQALGIIERALVACGVPVELGHGIGVYLSALQQPA
ncbi:MAG: alanine--glyoxylate aminotransferase family protein [Propionibacteriaceae bacterium]|nr:alanine--glyoxylate aminotransferase family protein [Propionibacteriaceae bacterium]